MNNKRVRTKAMAMAVAAAMAVELCPVTAFAVTGDQVAADGTYTSTAQVNRDPAADVDDDWADYGVSVELTVKDGKFENITVHRMQLIAQEMIAILIKLITKAKE